MIGSLTAVSASPAKATVISASASASSVGASMTAMYQCFVFGVAQLAHSRQPASVRASAGRSVHCAPKWSCGSTSTVS